MLFYRVFWERLWQRGPDVAESHTYETYETDETFDKV